MIGTYSRFVWYCNVFPSFINQCLPPFTFSFVFWKSVPLQNLNMRLYLQFVWVTSIIITYSNTTPVFLTISFVFFWVFFSTMILLPFSLSVYKSFTFKLLKKMMWYKNSKSNLPLTENDSWNFGIGIFCLQYAWNKRIFINMGT